MRQRAVLGVSLTGGDLLDGIGLLVTLMIIVAVAYVGALRWA